MENREYKKFADSISRRTRVTTGDIDHAYDVLVKVNQNEVDRLTDDYALTLDQKLQLDAMVLTNYRGPERAKLAKVLTLGIYDFGISIDKNLHATRNGKDITDDDLNEFFDFIYEKATGKKNEHARV